MLRGHKVLRFVTLELCVITVILAAVLFANRVVYDASYHSDNIDIDPMIYDAAPVGEEITVVMYGEKGGGRYLPPGESDLMVAFLGPDGEYTSDPAYVVKAVDPLGLPPDLPYGVRHDPLLAGTDDGATIIWTEKRSSKDFRLVRYHHKGDTGGALYPMRLLPELNVYYYLYTMTEGEDALHLIVWNNSKFNGPSKGPGALYLRSPDRGLTWEDPVTLLDRNSTARQFMVVVNKDRIILLMRSLMDEKEPYGNDQYMFWTSADDGQTLEGPIAIEGVESDTARYFIDSGLAKDGSFLLRVYHHHYSSGNIELYRVDTEGAASEIHVLPINSYSRAGLVRNQSNPRWYSGDRYSVLSVDGAILFVHVYDLSGRLLSEAQYDRYDT